MLVAIRLLKGISIETVATKVNFSFGHYRRIENGKTDIKVSKLLEIIKALIPNQTWFLATPCLCH